MTVGDGVIVGVGVSVGVFVAVGVFVGGGVCVGVGNVRGNAELLMLHAASLNWIENPKFCGPKLSGAFPNEPEKRPSQSMYIILPGFTTRSRPTQVVEEKSLPPCTVTPFHRTQSTYSFHP